MKLSQIAALALAMAGFASHAGAQMAGTYNGTQANGQSYSLTLGTDPNNGKLAITSGGVGFAGTIACKPATNVGSVGYGFGALQDITGPKTTFIFNFPQFYTVQTLTFSGNTVSGTITSYEVLFGSFTKKPSKASFCTVPSQTFTATLGAPAPAVTANTRWSVVR